MANSKSRRLNVLLISNLFPSPVDPIRGIFIFQLAKQLDTMCNLTVVCPLPWFPKRANIGVFRKWGQFALVPREYEFDGLIVKSPKYPIVPKISETAHAAFMFPTLFQKLKELHLKMHFDIVNTQWLYPDGVAASWATRLLRLPHVITALGCDANLFMKQTNKRIQIKYAINHSDGVTVVSKALRRFLAEEGFQDKSIDVIPNGVNEKIFYPRDRNECIKRLGLRPDRRNIVFVGQLIEVKGVNYLIEAVHKLVLKGKELNVYIIGEGEKHKTYEEEVKMRGLSGIIHLCGNRPHKEIGLWMGASDLFCLPSIREGFPNVVLEALFSGRPVVASNVGGIPEMVNEKNGILVDKQNAENLSKAIEKVLYQKWNDQTILSTVSHLSWKNAAKEYIIAFEKAYFRHSS